MQKRFSKLEGVLKYTIAVILLTVPLYPKFPLISIPGTYVAVRMEDFVMVFASLLLFYLLRQNLKSFFSNNINRSIFLFLFVGLVSLFSAIFVTQTVTPLLGLLHWARRVEYLIPYFLGVFAMSLRKSDLEFYLKVIMVSILVSFVYGLGQRYLQWPIIVTQNLEYSQGLALRYISGSHINAGFAGHYDLGTYLVLMLPVFISLFFLVKTFRTKFILLFCVSGGLWLLSFSGSRISAFSYIIASSLALIFIKKYKAIPIVILISFIFFSMSPNLTSRYLRIFQVTSKKILGIVHEKVHPVAAFAQDESLNLPIKRVVPPSPPTPSPVFEDRSTSIRTNVEWPRAARAFFKNPILGTGYSSITLATDNDFLRVLGELGLIGFGAFTLIFLRQAKYFFVKSPLISHYKGEELAYLSGISSGFIGVLINSFVLDVFEASKFAITFWLVTGMAVSLLNYKKNE